MTSPADTSLEAFRDVLRDFKIAMVASSADDGTLHARPIATAQFGADGDVYFFARASSALASEVRTRPQINLSYVGESGKYASIAGNAAIVDDRETAKAIWGPWCAEWFPGGADDPELLLVRVRVATVEYWSSPLDPVARVVEFRHKGARA
jgi:general stress protein 26